MDLVLQLQVMISAVTFWSGVSFLTVFTSDIYGHRHKSAALVKIMVNAKNHCFHEFMIFV